MQLLSRYITGLVKTEALLEHKMAFLGGPRQVGKSTIGKFLVPSSKSQFNWDNQKFRKAWVKDPLASVQNCDDNQIFLDEIHKDKKWKSRLKGIFDEIGMDTQIAVSGSARLDIYRRGQDSLLGRYLPFRIHGLTVAEQATPPSPENILQFQNRAFSYDDLLQLGGFPEPTLNGHKGRAERWSRLRIDRILNEDVRDVKAIHDLQALRVLTDLLPSKVGSLLSINSLREDAGLAYATAHGWVGVLEQLYFCFLIRPFTLKVSRSLKSEPKLFLYDILQIENEAARHENLVALHLLKACHYWTDAAFGFYDLHFLRTKEKKEIDFVVSKNKKPWMLVECKSNSTDVQPTLLKFAEHFQTEHNYQLVRKPGYDRYVRQANVRVLDSELFFSGLV